jgi:hypothetical protein
VSLLFKLLGRKGKKGKSFSEWDEAVDSPEEALVQDLQEATSLAFDAGISHTQKDTHTNIAASKALLESFHTFDASLWTSTRVIQTLTLLESTLYQVNYKLNQSTAPSEAVRTARQELKEAFAHVKFMQEQGKRKETSADDHSSRGPHI